jgi:hypothetical protein
MQAGLPSSRKKIVDRELNLSQVADGPRRGRVGDLHASTTDTPHENGRKLVHDISLFRTTHGRTNDAQLYDRRTSMFRR